MASQWFGGWDLASLLPFAFQARVEPGVAGPRGGCSARPADARAVHAIGHRAADDPEHATCHRMRFGPRPRGTHPDGVAL